MYPDIFKKTKVVPVNGKGIINDVNNYNYYIDYLKMYKKTMILFIK